MFQTFSRNDLPGEAPLSRGRSVFKKRRKKEEKKEKHFKSVKMERLNVTSFLFQRADLPGARTGGLPPIGGSPSRGARIFQKEKNEKRKIKKNKQRRGTSIQEIKTMRALGAD